MNREKIQEIIASYSHAEIKIGVLGSHSALEMGHGAKQEGFEVVVVCQKGREIPTQSTIRTCSIMSCYWIVLLI